jgi:hypothetical protein
MIPLLHPCSFYPSITFPVSKVSSSDHHRQKLLLASTFGLACSLVLISLVVLAVTLLFSHIRLLQLYGNL